jgi:hypothetical protein
MPGSAARGRGLPGKTEYFEPPILGEGHHVSIDISKVDGKMKTRVGLINLLIVQ